MPLFSGNMFQPWHCIPDILDTSHSHVLLGIAWSSRHHSQELIFKPMEAFQERLGDGKSEVVLCFQAVFFCFVDQKALRLIGNVFNTLINLENVFLSNFIYILLFTYYIYIWPILFQRFQPWRFQLFEAPLKKIQKGPGVMWSVLMTSILDCTRQTFFMDIFWLHIESQSVQNFGNYGICFWKFYSLGIGPWKKNIPATPKVVRIWMICGNETCGSCTVYTLTLHSTSVSSTKSSHAKLTDFFYRKFPIQRGKPKTHRIHDIHVWHIYHSYTIKNATTVNGGISIPNPMDPMGFFSPSWDPLKLPFGNLR